MGLNTIPEGYEIRTVSETARVDGRFVKVTPYYQGRPISEGEYPGIWGFGHAVRKARKAIRLHRRYGVDRKRVR